MAVDRTKLEAMLAHLLNERTTDGKLWSAITVVGIARFTRSDVEAELHHLRSDKRWWHFWKA